MRLPFLNNVCIFVGYEMGQVYPITWCKSYRPRITYLCQEFRSLVSARWIIYVLGTVSDIVKARYERIISSGTAGETPYSELKGGHSRRGAAVSHRIFREPGAKLSASSMTRSRPPLTLNLHIPKPRSDQDGTPEICHGGATLYSPPFDMERRLCPNLRPSAADSRPLG